LRTPIKAIAFDLWNTLVGCLYPVNPMLRLLEAVRLAGGEEPARLIAECTMKAPLPCLAAAVRELEHHLVHSLGRGEERARLLACWELAISCNQVFADVVPSLTRLRKRYRLGVISNTQSFDMEFWQCSDARSLLDAEVLSYEIGVLKPDPRLFRRFVRRIGVPAGQILMVGDNFRDDVEGARAAGLQAVRISRPLPSLSHRDPQGEDGALRGLGELEAKLRRVKRGRSGR
jgi:putative hydrolase of the HAD superfamily